MMKASVHFSRHDVSPRPWLSWWLLPRVIALATPPQQTASRSTRPASLETAPSPRGANRSLAWHHAACCCSSVTPAAAISALCRFPSPSILLLLPRLRIDTTIEGLALEFQTYAPTMTTPIPNLTKQENFISRHSVGTYFALTFGVSWLGAFVVVAPHLLRGEAIPKFAGLMMFPAMLLGPSAVSIVLTRFVDGPVGVRDLFSRMRRVGFPARWYAALLIPPVLVLALLFLMKTFVSPDFAPNRFFAGIGFGFVAGFFEEIGWMGFAFAKMRRARNALAPAILLGLLWAAWHIPVIDYLGTATPHRSYWLPFFFAFAAAMTAMRVLIAWVYSNTNSILLAQLLHAFSTGSLVVFSPPNVSGAQESLWYAIYAAGLWLVVAIVGRSFGKRLARP